MKLIIDIDEKDYEVIKRECSNKDVVPIGWVQILNGKSLQTELEEIKEAFCDMRDGYPKITDETLTVREVLEVIDRRIKDLNNE